MPRNNQFPQAGFTLIEVVAAILILGILAAVVVINSMDSRDTASRTAVLSKVRNHLRYARNRSMSSQEQWGINFHGSTYELERLPSGTGETLFFPGEEFENVQISPLSISTDVYFDEWGRPINSSGTSIPYSAADGEITINQTTGYIQ
ncbi:MAG: type II secretion system protein [Thermodesulfobacteriota bacterium]|nr:type II secretion system protein [Thermodesulfobacteriota bacterium]